MDDLRELKEKIYVDENIEVLLAELGCEHIHREQRGTLVKAQLPQRYLSNNRRAVEVRYNENLTGRIRNRGIQGTLFDVVGYILYDCVTFKEVSEKLPKIVKWICDTLGYDMQTGERTRPKARDVNKWLKKIKKQRVRNTEWESNAPINESILKEYEMIPNMWWKDEGISISTQELFEIGFDMRTERIVIPIRDTQGRLIGVKGRYMGDNQYIMEEKKYLYVVPCNKSVELYNLHRAMPYILKRKEVILFEAEKSVMFAWQYGFRNSVAIGGSDITPQQIQILKDLGIDIKWVFAWDSDKKRDFIMSQIGGIKTRTVHVIYDKNKILPKKCAPVDLGKSVWYNLYTNNKYIVHKGDGTE